MCMETWHRNYIFEDGRKTETTMQKFLITFLSAALIVCSFGCSQLPQHAEDSDTVASTNGLTQNESIDQALGIHSSQPIKYPGLTGIDINDEAFYISSDFFRKDFDFESAETRTYYVVGTVAQITHSDNATYYLIENEFGSIYVADLSKNAALNMMVEREDVSIDFEKLSTFYPAPSIGEYVCIAAQLIGHSENDNTLTFLYATTDYFTKAALASLLEDIYPDTSEGTSDPTTTNSLYQPGMYKVGTDLPEGEYLFIATGSIDAYVCVSTDSNQDDIVENENFPYSFFVTVEDGQYLEASRCLFAMVDSQIVSINEDGSVGEGMYRIGIDIPAGEYRLETNSDFGGYWCIYNSTVIPFDIENNHNFKSSTYVTVKDGQYLILNRCSGTLVE